MSEIQYNVRMYTPLGEKAGTMLANRTGNVLNGWLNILGHQEPFEGTIDEMGNCNISGLFITLMRRVSFVATGKFSDSSVSLQITGERNVFELSGEVCPESEESVNAKVL